MFPSSKEVFQSNLRQFLEIWFFDGKSTAAYLTKIVKFCTANLFVPLIKRSVSKHFGAIFGKLIFRQRKCFSTILGNFWKIDILKFDRRGPYKNSEILYSLKLLLENFFWLNYMFPSSKEVFLHNFRQFFENWFFDWNSTGATLTKIVKFCTILNCDKKIFLA